jgi:hypothetical protein
MHTLQEFVTNNVRPAIADLSESKIRRYQPETRGAYATVFESFLWLHLGTEIGIFPYEVSTEVTSFYYQPFFQSLNAKRDQILHVRDFEEFKKVQFASTLYVYDTPESTELKAAFPEFKILIEHAMRGENALKVQPNEFTNPTSLRPLFKNFLRLAGILSADPILRRFTNISQFTNETEWQNEWREGDCSPEEVEQAAENQNLKSRSPAVIFAGFLRLWSYSHQLTQIVQMYQDEPVRSDDRFKLIDRVKNILRWRINLRSAETANRFEAIRNALKVRLDHQAMEGENLAGAVDTIKKSFDSAFELWMVYQEVPA